MIEKFLKISTGGHQFSERTKRLLSIILIPVWTIGLIFTLIFTIQGVKAIPLYFKAKNLIPQQIELENRSRNSQNSETSMLQHYSFDPTPWKEIGIENPTTSSTMMPQRGMEIQKKKMYKCLSILAYFLSLFLIPFTILRLTYWVKMADK